MSLRPALRAQATLCAELGSPFMARLMALAADRLTDATAVGAHLLSWPGDVASGGQAVPLRFAGVLHGLVLKGDDGLAPHWPPAPRTDDDALWAAVEDALHRRGDEILDALRSPPQTNEVRRAAALIPALHMLAARFGLPLALFELGASAGLNLHLDQFALVAGSERFGPPAPALTLSPDWTGPAPQPADPVVIARAGVDIAPLDPADPEHRLRLLSYLWADQPDRRDRTLAAIAAGGTKVAKGDAGAWLAPALQTAPDEALAVVYHTIAWQYFPDDTRAAVLEAMRNAGRPVARIAMERDDRGPGAGVSLTLWPEGTTHQLARIDFHGRWVEWTGPTTLS